MYSGNQLNYLPPIIKENFEIFQLDFTANITYPYPVYKFFVVQLIDLVNINVLNYLNFLALFTIFFVICLVSYSFFKETFFTFGLITLILLSPSIMQFLFFKIFKIDKLFLFFVNENIWLYKHIILKINDYISSGFAPLVYLQPLLNQVCLISFYYQQFIYFLKKSILSHFYFVQFL